MPAISRSISRLFKPAPLAALLLCAMATPVALAENLQQIFDKAVQNDPEILGARARFNASHTLIDQGRSALLPTITGSLSTSRDASGVAKPDPRNILQEYSYDNGYNSHSYGITLSQALVNFKAWYAYQSARKGDEGSALTLQQSEQALILKVAKAYFAVLTSKANLASFTTEEKAAKQVLDQTQQKFDVGLVAITDVYDSQASADLAEVNRLTEENNLYQKLEALGAITGEKYDDVTSLSEDFPIAPVQPASADEWVKLAQDNNLAIKIAAMDLQAKQFDVKSARSDHYPTVSISARYNWSQNGNPISFTVLPQESSSIGLNFSIPIFSGGLVTARDHQANYNRDASEEALLKAQRDNLQAARSAYRNVDTDVRAVAARAQAIKSAQSSAEATQVGAEVGTRNIVDVVLSQRLLFQAQRDYANARLNYVLDTLTLKQSAGVLSPQDVVDLNQWLHQ